MSQPEGQENTMLENEQANRVCLVVFGITLIIIVGVLTKRWLWG